MDNLMIDIETMGIRSNAAIISIGAVFFDIAQVYHQTTFYQKINLQSCIDHGLTIDASTITWWLQQSEDARKEFFEKDNKYFNIFDTLLNFQTFVGYNPSCLIWANGSNFDIPILENAFRVCLLSVPWKYNQIRDFRTYKTMNPIIKRIPKDNSTHNALGDAIWQAEYAVELLNKRF